MNASTIAALLGGIGLFLLGMQMMTGSLKVAAGNALRSILQSWTSTNAKGLVAGVLITALVQSSSAVTVATVGFVNAGLLTLSQAIWVVFGSNLGSTITGWLVALVGIKIDVGVLALPLIGVGMLLRLAAGSNVRRAAVGEAVAGFGAFFLGIGILQGGFSELAPKIAEWPIPSSGWAAAMAFVGVGIVLTILTQSSSAAIAITLTAAAGGAVPVELAAATVIGANVGTTFTAWLASLGATPPAKRAAWAHIMFNLVTGVVAIVTLPLLLAASAKIASAWASASDVPTLLAVFHTLFNMLGVALMWPSARYLLRVLRRRFVSTEEEIGRPTYLDATLVGVPTLALRSLVLELERMGEVAFDLASRRIRGVAIGADTRRQAEGLIQLGNAVREFIGVLSKGLLPEDVVAALPDLLRASQHFEDVATESEPLGGPHPARPVDAAAALAEGASRDWAALREAVLATLTPGVAAEPDALAQRVELSYESLKAALLKAGARGRMPVDAMEEDLLRARRLRRVADSAVKARRRLARWLALAETAPASAGSVSKAAAEAPVARYSEGTG